MGLAFWRYLWRTPPLHRDTDGSADQDLPPPLPEELVDGRLQRPEDGSVPLRRPRRRPGRRGAVTDGRRLRRWGWNYRFARHACQRMPG
jgi:hypothetical protein